ncbi:hypothetical protein LJC27_08390, partial [Christensenellaceae bacterium OttesenSCG-928-M15]|nr:hypothetical protein [Christensenellaceae bacterium OttesenSCG-928-M15]
MEKNYAFVIGDLKGHEKIDEFIPHDATGLLFLHNTLAGNLVEAYADARDIAKLGVGIADNDWDGIMGVIDDCDQLII